ncbi:ARM repeat-containing protein [Basidiobolus meristosporus CBS 931.73]|uniref:ARM repeat-containing protein n=1 Tax=Basidiobolus meristosporus CBS 931.73 TaxID=1314790 RepID=A0A1Y1YUS5_9FUNG|nr:ARM repeat-containing protein [Basidiobolus meristosporus CBS 931.73]|eukprot:ORY01716.1 ARM repeat-containing protein [Basidiobolus meristosporus CBS 931.73]
MTTLGNIDPVFGRIHANPRDLSDRSVSPPSNICRFFQQGYCSRGDRCTFIHTFKSVPPESPHPILSPVSNGVSPYNYPASPLSPTFYNQLPNNGFHNYTKAGFNNLSPSNGKSAQPNSGASKQVAKKASTDVEASNRFSGVPIEDMVGEVYSLCKDQHGCRYLQKKLEEQNQKYVDIIFHEVYGHFVELMTDPFGNYLCQKLLEFCNDEQRTAIVDTVAPELVNISLNIHGTRAVQKMIEFLSNTQQIRMIIVALNTSVVTLIKDLNGNHVVQKCLNRLKSADNQFIYNGVCDSLIEVATHRHGCCVLQRCIDYSSETQKSQLVSAITYHALTLVQDPFGNYVVQYVLDLNEPRLSDPLIRRFFGNTCLLSVQKFSSNVMEKCIRVSKPETRKGLIDELLNRETLDKLLRDSFGNYVVQTALDYAEANQRLMLVDAIRPLLPAIRNTPYGKRIQGKLLREQVHSAPQQQNVGSYGYNYRGPMNMIGMNDVSYSYM